MNKEDRQELKEMLDLYFKPFTDKLEVHDRTLFGNGSEDNQGLRVKVHDLEEEAKRRTWVIRAMAVPVLGGIGLKLWEWMHR